MPILPLFDRWIVYELRIDYFDVHLLKLQAKGEETFITTTGTTHDNKWSQNPYKNELYKKAPIHWNQQMYVKDLREKLMHRPHRATLAVRFIPYIYFSSLDTESRSTWHSWNQLTI